MADSQEAIKKPLNSGFNRPRMLLAYLTSIISIILISLAVIAPIFESFRLLAAERIYRLLSFICHQIPSRSPFILGTNVGLCYRCMAIYTAIGVGIALPLGRVVKRLGRFFDRAHDQTFDRLTTVIAGLFIFLLFLDGILPFLGWPSSTNPQRISTGLLGGWAIVSLLLGTREN